MPTASTSDFDQIPIIADFNIRIKN
jgi:hypothetical protein